MKKVISLLLIVLLCGMLAVPALAAPEGPVITMQPQSHYYSEYSVAIYTVKATGTNLTATWYIEYQGKTYNASQIGGSMQPWEAYAGESYGAKKLDNNTFCFVFEGIGEELSGAEIWCEIEDGHYNVVSQVGHITVGNYGSPPEILSIPASITVKRGEKAEIRCVAKSSDGSQLNFLWYETGTGKFEDMQAIDRGAETGDYMFCDTRTVGTRYYVCGITTSGGGMAYSSMVDPDAKFSPYYNPGASNDMKDGSWLSLGADGRLTGTPNKAGTYSFSVCAAGAGGEDYATYTLTVVESGSPENTEHAAGTQTTEPTTTESNISTTPTAESTTTESNIDTTPTTDPGTKTELSQTGIPWWTLVLVGLGAAGIGVGVAVILIKKK